MLHQGLPRVPAIPTRHCVNLMNPHALPQFPNRCDHSGYHSGPKMIDGIFRVRPLFMGTDWGRGEPSELEQGNATPATSLDSREAWI